MEKFGKKSLFDITHVDFLEIMKIQEDFYSFKESCLDVIDKKLTERVDRFRQRLSQEETKKWRQNELSAVVSFPH